MMAEESSWNYVKKGPWAKKCKQPLEAEKGKETEFPLRNPEGTQSK